MARKKPAVRIQVDPARLRTLGLSLEDIRGVIAEATVSAPTGTLDGAQQAFNVYTNDQLLEAAPWNDLVLAWRNGAPVRVRDVGVALAGAEDSKGGAWGFAECCRASRLECQQWPHHPAVDQQGAGRERDRNGGMPSVRCCRNCAPSIPPSVTVDTLIDRTQTIRASVHEVEFTLLLSVLLVVAVIFLFLRSIAATLIPSITVPLAILGTAGGMYLLGYSLDNLSLMALTIAVGFVVDDAIVMLENIHRHVEAGMPRVEAAVRGASEVGFTIITIAVSLVAVFIPLLLMSGIVGRLFREFAVTVTMTIALSVVISLTLIPMLCSRFLKAEHASRHGRVYVACERGFNALLNGYRRA